MPSRPSKPRRKYPERVTRVGKGLYLLKPKLRRRKKGKSR